MKEPPLAQLNIHVGAQMVKLTMTRDELTMVREVLTELDRQFDAPNLENDELLRARRIINLEP